MRLGQVTLVVAAAFHAQVATLVDDLHPLAAPPAHASRQSAPFPAPSDEPPAGLTHDDWSQIQRAVDASEYRAIRVTRRGEAPALQAPNRKQAYRTTFRRDGIEIAPQVGAEPSWRLGLSVTGYGYAGDVRPVEPTEPQLEEERVEYRRGPVTEWYVNRPGGLEQGFELKEPRPRRDEPVVVTIAVQGDLDVAPRRDSASFANRAGQTVIRYAGLKAWDAEGRPLQSHLEALDRRVRLVVEASAARFPITVDPTFVHEAQLFGDGEPISHAGARIGASVSLSGDTVVVGADNDASPAGGNPGSAYVFVRSGTTWSLQQRLLASDGAHADGFGASVSLSGDTVVVGAFTDDTTGGADAGSAYVFVRSGTTWSEQQKLQAPDGAASDRFGGSVSLSGETVVVGAVLDDTTGGVDAGSAYVFVRSGTSWTEQQKLLASDGAANDSFGYSVSVSGDTAVVGAQNATTGGGDAGSAYVFVRSGTIWSEQQKLLASDGAAGDRFGCSVSVSASADTLVVGADGDDVIYPEAGSAYVFVQSGTTWTEQQKLVASAPFEFQYLGHSVSVSGNTIVAGAPHFTGDPFPGFGQAHVFVRSGTTWTEQQALSASDPQSADFFGASVSLSGETVVVGAPGNDAIDLDSGAAYAFVRSGATWSQQQKLVPLLDSGAGDTFGSSVALSGDTVVVGAGGDEAGGAVGAGSAYVFVRSGTTWSQQQKLTASDGTAGDDFGGSVSISGDTVVVGAPFAAPDGRGSAYVFVRSGPTWSEQQKLVASDGITNGHFGSSVSVSADTVVVRGNNAAYVFVRSGSSWTEQQKLTPSRPGSQVVSVQVSGDTIVAGSPFEDTPAGMNAGAAYVFVRAGTSWSQQQRLLAADAAPLDEFGWSVSISGDTVAVGAPQEFAGGDAGSAYVFARSGTTWNQQQKLLASDAASFDLFGWSVSISGDTVVVGVPHSNIPGGANAGSAYVFVRSGTTWTEQQKLLAPDGATDDLFGLRVATSADTVIVGVPFDDIPPSAVDAGSAHVFRSLDPQADLGVTKTDGQTTAVPGQPLTYTITTSNAGPSDASGAMVSDSLPGPLVGVTWTCVASPGSSCTASGSGNINDTMNLLVGGTATYTLTGTVDPAAMGTLVNMVTVTAPLNRIDPNPVNNGATDVDTLTPETDLWLTKTDSADPVSPGDPLTYSLTTTNLGPSDATGVTVVDPLPAGVTFVSSIPGPPTCNLAGVTVSCALGTIGSGSNTTVSINVTVDPSASGILVNTATVSGNETDPDPGNSSASAATAVGGRDGELAHGTDAVYDLASQPGNAAAEDVFRINQKPYSSYEILVDGSSGDIGSGAGPLLERIAPDGTTILQSSGAVGAGPARSLRWMNTTSAEVEGETIRVRSAGCATDCGADDVYRIRVYETSCSVPRFNNVGTQITVLVLQNPTDYLISGEIYFWISPGPPVAVEPFTLNPRTTLVLNTAAIPGASGVAGAITVSNDGRYGDLSGKTVALEPATGFSFDSPLVPRPR